MKRKMIGAAGAYMSGLFFASFFADIYGLVILSAVVVILLVIAKVRKFSRFDLYIIFLSFLTAFTVSMTYTLNCYCNIIEFAETTGSFSGKVIDYDVYDGDKASYVLDGKINGVQNAKIIFYSCEIGAEYGDTVNIMGCKFVEPENDYLFNSKDYYKSSHIFLRVNSAESVKVEYNNSGVIKKFLASLRKNIISEIRLIMGDETGGFLAGMIFGEKSYINDNTKTSLYRSGIGHILAVSGLHVSIIASVFMWILRKMRVNKYISFCLVNLLLLFFIALSEYPISAIRAAIMLDIMYAAPLFRRQNDSLNSLAVAAFIISVADPYSIYNSGFMLSLSGTFGMAVFGRFMTKNIENKYIRTFMICLCTTFSVMPVSICYFDEISLVSPFMNVIIVPLCTVAMILGIVYIITFGFFPFLLYISSAMIKIMLEVSEYMSSLDFAYLPSGDNIFLLIFILSGALILCLYLLYSNEHIISRSIAVLTLIFVAVFIISGEIRTNSMIVSFLGSGSNSVIVISHNGTSNVIDISGHYRSAKYVRKYLFQNGISNIASVILMKKTAAQEIVYRQELEPFTVDEIIALNDTDIYDKRLTLLSESEFDFYEDEYIVSYHNDIMAVKYGDCTISILTAKENIKTDGLSVYYDNIVKSTEIFDDSIFLYDINNFEVVLSLDGKYKLRSLYG